MENACFVEDSQKAKLNVLVSTVTDLILLLAMIFGVLRLKADTSIWRMLYRHVCFLCAIACHDLLLNTSSMQGLVWIVLATVGLVPPTVRLLPL